MLEYFIKIILSVLINKFFGWSTQIFKDASIKNGIVLVATKNIEHIEAGNTALSSGDLDGWLEQLNMEE